tara:strand:- start:1 stop:510 length:510 start_codon:yes stop_codon:yes gene_type:complete
MAMIFQIIGIELRLVAPVVSVFLILGCGGKEMPNLTLEEQRLIGIYNFDIKALANSAGVSEGLARGSTKEAPSLELSASQGKKSFSLEIPRAIVKGSWSLVNNELRLKQEQIVKPFYDEHGNQEIEKSEKIIILLVDSNGTTLRPVANEENGVRKDVPEDSRIPYIREN